jgi:hypothetical protein
MFYWKNYLYKNDADILRVPTPGAVIDNFSTQVNLSSVVAIWMWGAAGHPALRSTTISQ